MLKQITIAECDLCRKTEPAKAVSGRYNETDYTLPDGWSKGHNDSFILCPECASARELETTHSTIQKLSGLLKEFNLERIMKP